MARKPKVQQRKVGNLGIPGVDDLAPHEAPKPVKRDAARVVSLLVVVAAVVVFVVQNSASVPVHFLFVTGHAGLIWLVLGSLAVGLALGVLFARQRQRAAAKSKRHQ